MTRHNSLTFRQKQCQISLIALIFSPTLLSFRKCYLVSKFILAKDNSTNSRSPTPLSSTNILCNLLSIILYNNISNLSQTKGKGSTYTIKKYSIEKQALVHWLLIHKFYNGI